jgi:hypothetical protein
MGRKERRRGSDGTDKRGVSKERREGGKTDLSDLVELNEESHTLSEKDHPAGVGVVVYSGCKR